MWKGTEAYEDVKYISSTSNKEFYTALNNDDQHTCVDWDCTAKLVMKSKKRIYFKSLHRNNSSQIWKQTKTGAEERFHFINSYGRFVSLELRLGKQG